MIATGINLAVQLHNNGGNWGCIDWTEAALWGGAGAIAIPVLIATAVAPEILLPAYVYGSIWLANNPGAVYSVQTALAGLEAYGLYDAIHNGNQDTAFYMATGYLQSGTSALLQWGNSTVSMFNTGYINGRPNSPYRLSPLRTIKDFGKTLQEGRPGPFNYGNQLYPELGDASIVEGKVLYANEYANGKFIWVQEPNGTIRFAQDIQREQGVFRTIHPMLARGQQVISAGEMEFIGGELQWINNGSGHYVPNLLEVYDVRDILIDTFKLSGPAEVVPYIRP
ncbi:hypothetical protein MASR2M66_07120 [Chloroflexota bacterium]